MDGLIGAGVVMWLLVLFVAILWILMPFAIFGTKPILKELLAEQRKTNKLLEAAAAHARAVVAAAHTAVSERARDV